MEPSIIVTTIENHGKRITDLETRMTLNEERDSHRDKQIEALTKEINQSVTATNMLIETVSGENGLIQSVKDTREDHKRTEKNQNKAAGFLAFAGLVAITLAGWGYSAMKDHSDKMYEQAKEIATLKAEAKKGE